MPRQDVGANSTAIRSRLDDLQAAALCFSATQHKTYTDPRRLLLQKRAHRRLLAAAKAYHTTVMALLGRAKEPWSPNRWGGPETEQSE